MFKLGEKIPINFYIELHDRSLWKIYKFYYYFNLKKIKQILLLDGLILLHVYFDSDFQ